MNNKKFRYPFECPNCGSWDTFGVWDHTIDNDVNDWEVTDCYTNVITNEVVYDLEHITNESFCNCCQTIYND